MDTLFLQFGLPGLPGSFYFRNEFLLNTLSDVFTIGAPFPGNVQIAHKAIIDLDLLASVLPGASCFMDHNVVDQLMEHRWSQVFHFFHSLVLNGCMKYSPKDLQFWLLDFKNGGASSKYSNSGLPHIRIIAENNKIDDALCLFQMVLEEMERRSKAFNKNFADNIVDYNKTAVEKGLEYFPRIVIAIDEVQEIFREDNASVLQKLISSISTRMRSAGMHFVMVAQNLSDGKAYMLKDAFLPSATGRICFRVAQDIPRDSGFDDDFVQRKQEIAEAN